MDSSSSRSAASGAAPTVSSGAVFISAAIFLLFLTFALALIILRHSYFSSTGAAPSQPRAWSAQVVAPPPRARGVDPELLRSLPVTVHRAADGVGSVECAVCLAELEDGEEVRFLPRCGHGFHAGCADRWLASHTTCPLCRVTVGKPDALISTTSLPPVAPEPAIYAANLPASALLGVSDRATLGTVTVATDGVLVIDVPESRMAAAIPRDASKSPGVNRLRSVKRLWSFGRQGPSGSTSPCAGGSGTADLERGISITYASLRAPVRCSVEPSPGTAAEKSSSV
ncbi:E3 ubiquitin-protein ligase EL5-like [Triticum dicoccoides]|uniref:E3 ubiquitin-protein ligase EL5-like n=1 Tax=Triticum dicoccoides TaxID=85692 RepID=UPI00189036CD|nr:E3 ubiquitin-protein ligase EL5-like [Triticum dicoccoides]